MTRRPLVIGNWKMHTTRADAVALASAIAAGQIDGVDVAVCPPFAWLVPVAEALASRCTGLGAQDCWAAPKGAVTGAVSAAMLAELCAFVIVGHSERRSIFGETDHLVREKALAVLDAGMTPIVCVGEDQSVRQAGQAAQHVQHQVLEALGALDVDRLSRCVIAYEPIWAIGTGVAAQPADAEGMAASIRRTLTMSHPAAAPRIRLLYGGSVTEANAAEILHQPNVDGALVGGASLNAESFLAIARAAVSAD